MIKIGNELINPVCRKANLSERKRINYNFHKDGSDLLQRLINVINPDSYVQPHKHENPDKREVFIILEGELLVLTFNNIGEIKDHYILNHSKGNYAIEILPGEWHTTISLQRNTVFYEVKDGPYNPADDKHFAEWAPKEGSADCLKYINKILKELKITK